MTGTVLLSIFLMKGRKTYQLKTILVPKLIQLKVDLYENFKACHIGPVSPYET